MQNEYKDFFNRCFDMFNAMSVNDLGPLAQEDVYQSAVKDMCRRMGELANGISILIDNRLICEAAILFRSQMNLHWVLLFLVDGRFKDKRWSFEISAPEGSERWLRAHRYINWGFVSFYRYDPSNTAMQLRVASLAKIWGIVMGDIPEYWYHGSGVNRIRDVADKVGALKQYKDDYSFLSGIEHSESNATLVTTFKSKLASEFFLIDALSKWAFTLEISFHIFHLPINEVFKTFVVKLDKLHQEIRAELGLKSSLDLRQA